MALFLDVLPGETVSIGNGTRITVEEKSGQRTRMRIDSDEDIRHGKAEKPRLSPPNRDDPAPTAAAPTLRRPILKLAS